MPSALGLGNALDLRTSGDCGELPVVVSVPPTTTYTGNGDLELVTFTVGAEACGEPLSGYYSVNWYAERPLYGPGYSFMGATTSSLVFNAGYADEGFTNNLWYCTITVNSNTVTSPTWQTLYVCSTAPNVIYNSGDQTVNNGASFLVFVQSTSCGPTQSTMERRLATDPPGVWTVVGGPDNFDDIGRTFTATPTLNGAQYRTYHTNAYGTTYSPVMTITVI